MLRNWMMRHNIIKRIVALILPSLKNHLPKYINVWDNTTKKLWEWRHYFFPRLPSNGEMTAILARMNAPGFSVYTLLQKTNYYGQRNFIPTERQKIVDQLCQHYPEDVKKIIACADQLLQGQFDLLGSGHVDLRRGAKKSGKIDWRLDASSGFHFKKIFSHWGWNLSKLYRGNAVDIKGPWEIGRCQHFATLGQAYWLTNDERYAKCFADTISDFIAQNPVGIGVQWACTMDVGLRLVSWLVGISFFQGARVLTYRWWRKFLKALVAHGRFIANNLEFGTLNNELIMGNHYVSDLLGLYWLALSFPALDAGVVWRGIAELGFEREIQTQILPDGGDFENSVPYHGLVTEIFLSAYAMSMYFKKPFSTAYREKLISALRFIKLLRQPNGRLPQVGDADNGRAHILTHYYAWPEQHMDNLLSAGAQLLNLPELAEGIKEENTIEKLFWPVAENSALKLDLPSSMVFPDSGLAVLRKNEHYLLLSNTPVGTRGIGNHKHNDQLAIEWVVGDQPIFIDAGCYIYTKDGAARNQFRSAKIHNTVVIDDEEQHRFNPEWLFRMGIDGKNEISQLFHRNDAIYSQQLDFRRGANRSEHRSLQIVNEDASKICNKAENSSAKSIGVIGSHTCYERLQNPLTHQREIVMQEDGVIILTDRFITSKPHHYRWQFLLHPLIKQYQLRENGIELIFQDQHYYLICQEKLSWRVEESWISPSYGKREKTLIMYGEKEEWIEKMVFMLIPTRLIVDEKNKLLVEYEKC